VVESPRIARFVVPAVTMLSSDPDRAVRMRCIDACGAIAVNVTDLEVRARSPRSSAVLTERAAVEEGAASV
jgi:hypothetical protein